MIGNVTLLCLLTAFSLPATSNAESFGESTITGDLAADKIENFESPESKSGHQFVWTEGNTICRDMKCGGVIVPIDLAYEGKACSKLPDWTAASHAYYSLSHQLLINTPSTKGYGFYNELLDEEKSVECTRANFQFNFTSGSPPDSDCKNRGRALNPKINHPIGLEAAAKQITKKSPQVIFIGETHWSPAQLLYERIVPSLKKEMPDIDCIFLEIPPKEFEDVISEARRPSVDPKSEAGNFINIVRAADNLKIRLIPADSSKPSEEAIPNPTRRYEIRNQGMAKTLLKNFSGAKACHRAIFPVGAAHLTKTSETPSAHYRTLQQMVPPLKLRSTKIFLAKVGDEKNSETLFTWQSCFSNPVLPKKPGAFTNQEFPKHLKIFNGLTTGGQWQDFDYTFFSP
jgi:hypothetical protein